MELTDDQQRLLERIRVHLRERPVHRLSFGTNAKQAEAVLAQVLGLVEPPLPLRRPVTPQQLAAAETELGLRLPMFLGALST
jgi:hypothetical protein